jgi:diaminohydroxyphosphoribosylaminopyrimidine deaminase/5-amino-6-(5-phosphoribosylamino)uracil reductase
MNFHNKYMQLAFELAYKGWGTTSPNPMVGAVIVKGGKVISQGWHKRCGGNHAEINAFKKAGAKAKGATLYVTLEPCSHFGRTPPCTEAIIKAGISKVVIGVLDPNPINRGKAAGLLKKVGIAVESGFLQEELTQLNESFNKYITQKLPLVVAKTAQTLDGKIATSTGHSQWITSPTARQWAHRMRFGFDAIMVGINTVLKDNPRLNSEPKKAIKKVVLDSTLKTPLKAKLFEGTKPEDVLIVTTAKASPVRLKLLSKKAQIIIAPSKGAHVDMVWTFKELARREIASVLIEGGSMVIGRALKNKLVDKYYFVIAPKIMGDEHALDSVRGFHLKTVHETLGLKNMTMEKLGEDILIGGHLVYRNH